MGMDASSNHKRRGRMGKGPWECLRCSSVSPIRLRIQGSPFTFPFSAAGKANCTVITSPHEVK